MDDKRISSRVILTFKEFLIEIDIDVEVDNEVKRRVDPGKSPKSMYCSWYALIHRTGKVEQRNE